LGIAADSRHFPTSPGVGEGSESSLTLERENTMNTLDNDFARLNPDAVEWSDDPPPSVAKLRIAAASAIFAGLTDSEIAAFCEAIGPAKVPNRRATVKIRAIR